MALSLKLVKYNRLYDQISKYVVTTTDVWARLATMEAVLHNKMQYYFWTGVYVLIDDDLIVKSYQGPVACQKLKHHEGVCWTSILSEKPIVVPDVSTFQGHIACNAKTKSEMVVPIRDKSGKIFACFDVDSDKLNMFDNDDVLGLEKILTLLF